LPIEPAPGQGGALVLASVEGDLATLYPLGGDWGLGFLCYQALIEIHPVTLEPVGRLAEGWEVSEDGLTWTIALRPGVRWQDGEPFTSADVKFSYELQMNPESPSEVATYFSEAIASVEAPDDLTVVFNLHRRESEFANDHLQYLIAAKHVLEGIPANELATSGVSTGSDPSLVVGTGPFKFQEWISGDRLVMVRNDDYWDGQPHLDQVIERFVADGTAIASQLRTGEIDAGIIEPAMVPELEAAGITITSEPNTAVFFIAFNQDPEKTTLFQDKRVRQALWTAIDRQALVDAVVFGFGEVAESAIPPTSWVNQPEEITVDYPYDPERAAALLEEAGWTMGADNVRQKDGQPFAFTVWGTAGDGIIEAGLAATQAYWRAVGVQAEIQLQPDAALYERFVEQKDYEACWWRAYFFASPSLYWLYASASYPDGGNRVMYANPEADELIAEIAGEPDRERQVELATQLQNIVLEDAPYALLFWGEQTWGVSPRAHNFLPNALNFSFNAETWWVES
jgi:peptide/nickel transport system substrate-binding protein